MDNLMDEIKGDHLMLFEWLKNDTSTYFVMSIEDYDRFIGRNTRIIGPFFFDSPPLRCTSRGRSLQLEEINVAIFLPELVYFN
jgi:hypothetical protein